MIYVVGVQAQEVTADSSVWENEIKQFEEADRKRFPPTNAVLFVGSSSVRMWKNLTADFPRVKTINRGFGGSQIMDSTFYANRIIIPYRPRLIVLYAGDNDLASGKSPAQVFDDYRRFITKVRRSLPNARVAYISIKPSPARIHLLSSIKATNRMIENYSARARRVTYIDIFTPMLDETGKPRAELYVEDGLHLSAAGYKLWKTVTAPHLK